MSISAKTLFEWNRKVALLIFMLFNKFLHDPFQVLCLGGESQRPAFTILLSTVYAL